MPRVLIVAEHGLMRQGLSHSKPSNCYRCAPVINQELPIRICSPYSPRERNSVIPIRRHSAEISRALMIGYDDLGDKRTLFRQLFLHPPVLPP